MALDGISATEVYEALHAHPDGLSLEWLAERLRGAYGAESLALGSEPLIEGLTVAWAIELPDVAHAPQVVSLRGTAFCQELVRLGESALYALAVRLPDGTTMECAYQLEGTPLPQGPRQRVVEAYRVHPARLAQPQIPRGTLLQQPRWHSTIFAGTVRDWWIYVPAQYEPGTPSCVMVFQDGGKFYKDQVPTVFDSLIADGGMPVTLGLFIEPGTFADTTVSNRSVEYDTLSDRYVRFLLEEMLPEVARQYTLREDPYGRAICGFSSGGICAFTAAWQRPDQFSKVLSWSGSFTNIAAGPTLRDGGHNYPALIRRLPRKPLRVFLQGGANDMDNEWGSWALAHQEMAAALAFAGYDARSAYGQGFHTPFFGHALLPEALSWLWRDRSRNMP